METLRGRVALVTGGSRNLGATLVECLAERGARVAFTYHTHSEAAEALARGVRQGNGEAVAVGCGLTTQGEVARLAEQVTAALGPVDVLIHNAGPFSSHRFIDLPEAAWDEVMNVNLKAAYLLAQAFGPSMVRRGWGRVVFLGAVSACNAEGAVYGLAKAGLPWLARALALELAPQVTVNVVAPGQIGESLAELEESDPGLAARKLAATPLGQFARRGPVADLVLSLCSPGFDHTTGAVIPIDGGASIPRMWKTRSNP